MRALPTGQAPPLFLCLYWAGSRSLCRQLMYLPLPRLPPPPLPRPTRPQLTSSLLASPPLLSSTLPPVLRLTTRLLAQFPSSTCPVDRPSSPSLCPRGRCCEADPPRSSIPGITPEVGCAEASGPALHSQVARSLRKRDPTYPRATEAVVANRLNGKQQHPALQCWVCFSPAGMSPEVFILLISWN